MSDIACDFCMAEGNHSPATGYVDGIYPSCDHHRTIKAKAVTTAAPSEETTDE